MLWTWENNFVVFFLLLGVFRMGWFPCPAVYFKSVFIALTVVKGSLMPILVSSVI